MIFLHISEKQLRFIIIEMFAAGIDTTTYTLLWTMLYMILNPDIQAKALVKTYYILHALVGNTHT